MKTKYIKFGVVALILASSIIGVSMMLNSSNGTMLDVNLIFDNQIDNEFLNKISAQVNTRIDSINAISAFVPTWALDTIMMNPLIRSWEYNMPVQAWEDSLDWGVDRVDAERVWGGAEDAVDVTGTCGTSIKVAVIDTGIDYGHPDLAPNYAGGYDFVNDDSDPLDDHYHGTHVSGTIAAADDEPNALSGSLIGVAPCISLYGVKVLDSQGSGTAADVAAGIEWAADNGMNIASLSLGSSSPSSTIETAGQYAASKGVLLVAASGNDGSSVGYPAAYSEFIAVGATDQSDVVASFSNYGLELEISAPGVDIESTTPTYLSGRGPFNPSPNYDTLSGTSMATPHVSAVAALAWSTDTSLTATDIRTALQNSAEDVNGDGWDEKYGYGIVDAEAAVVAAGGDTGSGDTTAPSQVTGLTATTVSSSQIDLSWDPASDDTGVDHYNIYRDTALIATSTSTSYSDTGLVAGTTYTYEVSAEDAAGNEGALSDPASATTDSDGGSTGTMHVSSIEVTNPRNRGPWRDIQAVVSVVDGNGNGLEGVTVSVQLDTPSNSYAASATTDSNGNVVFYWEKADRTSGTYTVTVTDLTKSGYTYDSASNVETSDSIVV